MWMCHVSFNYLLTPNFVNVPHVNIVSVQCVTKQVAKCSIYIVVTCIVEMFNLHNYILVEIVIIFLVDVMPNQ